MNQRFVFRVVPVEQAGRMHPEWVRVWVAASNAGGAIDFARAVGPAEVEPLVDAELAMVETGSSVLGVVEDDGQPVAFAVLTPGRMAIVDHRGLLGRVMVDPSRQGMGLGRRVVHGLHHVARALGLRQLSLTARGGLGLEIFYGRLGYEVIGRHPDGIRIGPDQYVEEIILLTRL